MCVLNAFVTWPCCLNHYANFAVQMSHRFTDIDRFHSFFSCIRYKPHSVIIAPASHKKPLK